MAEDQYPSQIRAIDPFASYNSNTVNILTRMVTGGSDVLFSPNPIDVTYDTTSPTQAVVVTPGGAFKDDVWVQITANHRVDFNKSFNYNNFGSGFNEEGYYYIVLEYTYQKSKPAPKASIKIIKPSQRVTDFTDAHLFLKAVKVELISSVYTITELLGYDPENPSITRMGTIATTTIYATLPAFEDDDTGKLIYVEDTDSFYFGLKDSWQAVFQEAVRINIDTTGTEVGELVYVDANGAATPAQSNAVDTVSRAVVSSVGLESDGTGKAQLLGKVKVKLESGINISEGEPLYLSTNETGTVTDEVNRPKPIYQYVGVSLETATGPALIDALFAPGPPTIDAPFAYRTTTGLNVGQLCYVKADGTMGASLADATLEKFAVGVVMQVGTQLLKTGIIRLSGEVDRVPIENGITIAVGDRLWLSDDAGTSPYGRVTNVEPSLYVQEVGVAISAGTGNAAGTNTITILFNPNPGVTAAFITAADVTYDNLSANGDVGTGSTQVSQGNHTHTQYTDIPTGEIILFEKDTAVVGYSLLAGYDDGLVYVTKGSAAGGETGGTNKFDSKWTQPNHLHATSNHNLTEAELPNVTGSFEIWRTSVVGETQVHNPQGVFSIAISGTVDNSVDYQGDVRNRDTVSLSFGSGNAHNHGNTQESAPANTWRPRGRNFTRQQRT
jgi:hypothetical protein